MSKHYSHTTDAIVVWKLAFTLEVTEKSMAGHADLFETALMLYYEKEVFGGLRLVDLSTLPARRVPLHYRDFSIVDGAGFSEHPSPDRVVTTDPRDATVEKGKKIFDDTVTMFVEVAQKALAKKGL